ncbi:HNH endonuclease [Henriciella barbarensis]|uniref:HNH endonuclease n=1 Tax=Henriciella barbarensis TaxID=86342 RepID=A0A399R4M9_9PROT|nr:HNH endonuclease signature motif containing protein [Henriciella barbarensis]RIJ25883.1 HNH endonuclease [Henriciella barbarensis]
MVEPRPLSRANFDSLWAAQSGQCALCGKAMPRGRFDVAHASIWKKQRPTFDHIVPKAAGGPDRLENLQLAHAVCNKRKGKRQAGGVDGRDAT